MNHAASCRAALEAALPWLKNNPDQLVMFIENGSIAAGLGKLGFSYSYTLTIGFLGFAHHLDTVIVPLIQWIRENQPALLQNPDSAKKVVSFESEILNSDACDLTVRIQLYEGVRVVASADGVAAEHLPEPVFVDPSEYPIIERVMVYGADGVLIDDSADTGE